MSVAKVIEVNASSEKSVEDAVRHGLKKTSETVKGIKGVWVNEIKAVTNDTGDITEWRVNPRITFLVGCRDLSGAGIGAGAGPCLRTPVEQALQLFHLRGRLRGEHPPRLHTGAQQRAARPRAARPHHTPGPQREHGSAH